MTARSLPSSDARQPPALGGLNPTVLGLEIRRLLRNRRTMIFALIAPSLFFLLFGLNKAYAHESAGHSNVSAFILVSMALYGAVLATTAGGAMVSIERAAGWSRQLRLTPLSPTAYIMIKMLTAMVLGLTSVIAVYIVGIISRVPKMMPGYGYLWIVTPLCVWVGSLVFAAFGLFLGYLLPTENVMQFLGRSGRSTPWPGWSSSLAARSGGSARTPRGSDGSARPSCERPRNGRVTMTPESTGAAP